MREEAKSVSLYLVIFVPDDSLADESNVADLTEGQGADEEVCLLPDTEREISEADKQRALAAKNTPKEVDSADSAFDSLVAGTIVNF